MGEVYQLGVDSPAAINAAANQSVRRWRAANVLQKESATRQLLADAQAQLPPHALRNMAAEWRRAQAMAGLHCNLEDFTALLRHNSSSAAEGWQSKFAPHLLSAVSNKQWPQARVVGARHAAWSTDPNCQLCHAEVGTLEHRHKCPCILAAVGVDEKEGQKRAMESAMEADRARLWATRGIGAFKIHVQRPDDTEWLKWIRRPAAHLDEKDLHWYVDASQIDDESDYTRRFGFGIVTVDGLGRLVAAALGTPPPYVQTIAQAEAHAVATVMRSTTARAEIVTDCLSNLLLLKGGFTSATNGKKRAARTWNIIANAADWDHSAVPLRWIPAHRSWASVNPHTPIPSWSLGRSDSHSNKVFSRIDWQCNRAVDLLAKSAAQRHRTDAATRARLRSTRAYTRAVRARLGQVTWASQSTTKWCVQENGSTKAITVRDSMGKPAGNAPRALARKRPRATPPPGPEAAPPAEVSAVPAACPTDSRQDPTQLGSLPWAEVSYASDRVLAACRRIDSCKKRSDRVAVARSVPPNAAAYCHGGTAACGRIRRLAGELCATASQRTGPPAARDQALDFGGRSTSSSLHDVKPEVPGGGRLAFLAQLQTVCDTRRALSGCPALHTTAANAEAVAPRPRRPRSLPAHPVATSRGVTTAMRNLMAGKRSSADDQRACYARGARQQQHCYGDQQFTQPHTPLTRSPTGAARTTALPGRQAANECAEQQ